MLFWGCRVLETFASNRTTSEELQRVWKEVVVTQSLYYPGICPEVLGKATNNLSNHCRCFGRDSIQGFFLNAILVHYR